MHWGQIWSQSIRFVNSICFLTPVFSVLLPICLIQILKKGYQMEHTRVKYGPDQLAL